MDPSLSWFRYRIMAAALSSFAGKPALFREVRIWLFWRVPDLLRQRVVKALSIVASFCSIRERNCFQPIDLQKRLLLVRCKRSFAYRFGRFLFRIATSKSSNVTCPSPSLSNSSKNRLPYINKCHGVTFSSCNAYDEWERSMSDAPTFGSNELQDCPIRIKICAHENSSRQARI